LENLIIESMTKRLMPCFAALSLQQINAATQPTQRLIFTKKLQRHINRR